MCPTFFRISVSRQIPILSCGETRINFLQSQFSLFVDLRLRLLKILVYSQSFLPDIPLVSVAIFPKALLLFACLFTFSLPRLRSGVSIPLLDDPAQKYGRPCSRFLMIERFTVL